MSNLGSANNLTKIRGFCTSVLAVSVFATLQCHFSKPAPDLASGLKKSFPSFEFKTVDTSDTEDHKFQSFEATSADQILKAKVLTGIKKENAERIMALEENQIRSVYRTDRQPYHDVVTRYRGCPESEQPQFEKSEDGLTVRLIANERLNFGFCDPKQNKFRATFKYLHCEKLQRLYILKLYSPRPGNPAEDFKCPEA